MGKAKRAFFLILNLSILIFISYIYLAPNKINLLENQQLPAPIKFLDSSQAEAPKENIIETPIQTPVPTEMTVLNPSKCIVGGCSSQYCVDELKGANLSTTCEWKEYYACFRSAICEIQANGECGWRQTKELLECINNSN